MRRAMPVNRRRLSRVCRWLARLLPLVAISALLHAAARADYVVTDVGALGDDETFAYGLNDLGRVVGDSYAVGGEKHAFLSAPGGGALSDLGTLGGSTSTAQAVNASGWVVGTARTAGDEDHAFLYRGDGMIDLGTLGGENSTAHAINAAGQVAGYAETPNGARHAFIYRNDKMIDLGTLPGGTHSRARGINDNGHVVGQAQISDTAYRAFLAIGDKMDALPQLGTTSFAWDINNADQIVGYYRNADGAFRAFLYSNTLMQDLATLGGFSNRAFAINDAGEVVGRSQMPTSRGFHAFLFSDGAMVDLNDLLPEESPWVLTEAWGINNFGQIVGIGFYHGVRRGFLLSSNAPPPSVHAPEPSSLALLGLGTFGLSFLLYRRRRVEHFKSVCSGG